MSDETKELPTVGEPAQDMAQTQVIETQTTEMPIAETRTVEMQAVETQTIGMAAQTPQASFETPTETIHIPRNEGVFDEPPTETLPAAANESVTETRAVPETRALPETRVNPGDPLSDGTASAQAATSPLGAPSMPSVSPTPPASGTPMPPVTPPSTPFGAGAPNPQPVVQVPPMQIAPRPVLLQRTGPNAPTVAFGVIGVIVGCVGLILGLGLPDFVLAGFDWKPEALFALVMGAVGGLLVIVAAIWACVAGIRAARERSRLARDESQPAGAGKTSETNLNAPKNTAETTEP